MDAERYTAIRVRVADAEAFRRLARQLAARADRDVTQSEVLALAATFGAEHLDQLAARLVAPRRPAAPGEASSDPGARTGAESE